MANTPETISYINLGDGQGDHPIDAVSVGGKTVSEIKTDFEDDFQLKSNIVTSVSSSSTDEEYPSAKCIYDILGNLETRLSNI